MKKEGERESERSFLIPKTIHNIKEDKTMETEKLVIEIQAIADGVEGTIDSVRQELDALTQQMDTYNGQLGKIAGAQAGAKDPADTLKDAIKGITDAAEEARELV